MSCGREGEILEIGTNALSVAFARERRTSTTATFAKKIQVLYRKKPDCPSLHVLRPATRDTRFSASTQTLFTTTIFNLRIAEHSSICKIVKRNSASTTTYSSNNTRMNIFCRLQLHNMAISVAGALVRIQQRSLANALTFATRSSNILIVSFREYLALEFRQSAIEFKGQSTTRRTRTTTVAHLSNIRF